MWGRGAVASVERKTNYCGCHGLMVLRGGLQRERERVSGLGMVVCSCVCVPLPSPTCCGSGGAGMGTGHPTRLCDPPAPHEATERANRCWFCRICA